MKTYTLTKHGEWWWDGGSVRLCAKGLAEYIIIPKRAKKLHVTLRKTKPRSMSNVLTITVCVDTYTVNTSVEGVPRAFFEYDVRRAITSMGPGRVYAVFEWS